MAHEGEIQWFSPPSRGLIPLDDRFHIPHGLKRALKRQPFEVRWDTAFREVMLACADREETWIDEVILESYCHLHQLGHAHSVECWDEEGLQGGLYGVELPGVFFGESMFSRKTDASKIALVALVGNLRARNFQLLDTQWMTEPPPPVRRLRTLAETIPRRTQQGLTPENRWKITPLPELFGMLGALAGEMRGKFLFSE